MLDPISIAVSIGWERNGAGGGGWAGGKQYCTSTSPSAGKVGAQQSPQFHENITSYVDED